MNRIRRHLSFANATSLAALVFAMGGTGYAAIHLSANSVGTTQIKTHAVTGTKIASNAVTTSKVKDGSLLSGDFKAGQLPAGPVGATGPAGPTGAPGPAGTATAYARVDATGVLDPGTPVQSKGVVQVDIEHENPGTTGPGVYCFGGLPFTVGSAVVTVDSANALTTSNQIAAVAVQRGNNLGNCDASHQQARVSLTQVDQTNAPALTDHGFTIWFEAAPAS